MTGGLGVKIVERLRRSGREERGAVLALTAICMIVIIGMAGMAIDVGQWYQNERQAQSAADAAALAGVQDLPGNLTTANADATSYVGKNLPGATAAVTTTYNGDPNQIKVTVSDTAPSWFVKLFGITSVNVSASAVAKKTGGGPAPAVFAKDSSCSNEALTINGGNITVVGGVHSNGSLTQNSNNGSFGATTYGGPNVCSFTPNGTGDTYTGGAPVRDASSYSWPYDYSVSPPACTYSQSSFSFTTDNAVIPPGVYCATGIITINGANISGNVTFIADSFNINSSSFNFTPATGANGLLFYQTGTQELAIPGNTMRGGTVFAPNARIKLTGGNGGSGSGALEGLDVILTGNNGFTWTGTGTSTSGGTGGALTQ